MSGISNEKYNDQASLVTARAMDYITPAGRGLTAASTADIARIAALLQEGGADTLVMRSRLGMSKATISTRLARMRELGLAYGARKCDGSGYPVYFWQLGSDPALVSKHEVHNDGMPTQRRLKVWARGAQVDPMALPRAFFGSGMGQGA